MRALWMQVARTSSARGYSLAALLVATFITARYLGPEGRGVAAAALGWVGLFAVLAGLSVAQVVFFLAAGKSEGEWLPRTFTSLAMILAAATVIGWIVAAICALPSIAIFKNITTPILLLAFALLPLLMWNEAAGTLMVAMGALDKLNFWQVVGSTVSIAVLVVLVVWAGLGVAGAVLATGAYQIVLAIVTFLFVGKRAGRFEGDRGVTRTVLTGGLRLHLSVVAGFATLQANVLFVNAFRSAAETGYYHLASQLILAVQLFSVSVGMVAQGVVSRDGPDRGWPRQRNLLFHSSVVALVIMIAGLLLAPLVVRILGGAEFMPAVPILRVLLLGLVGINVGMVMSSQWVARGMFLRLTAISVVLGIASIAGNYLMIPRYGAIGSAWVTTAVYTASIFIHGGMAFWVDVRAKNATEPQTLSEAAS